MEKDSAKTILFHWINLKGWILLNFSHPCREQC